MRGILKRPLLLAATVGEGALKVALAVVGELRSALETTEPAPSPRPRTRPAPPPPPAPTRRRARTSDPPPRTPEKPPPPAPPVPDTAKTIDDAPVPVAEFGEEGAREDAGAEVHVDEPWEGYAKMTATQVKDRLAGADRVALAAVVLYEGFGRRRSTVVEAAERRLTRLSAPRS